MVEGVCLLSREAVFANAKVALAANQRLEELAAAAQAEVAAASQPINDEIARLRADTSMSREQRGQQEEALTRRLAPVQALAQQRSREIEATRAGALQRIAADVQPLIGQAYRARGCGLLIDRGSVLGGNFANDLTPEVVRSLDARVTTIAFDRETLPPEPPGLQQAR